MINKQSLWFLTLFSLILVLSVYYVTMPNELLLKSEVNDSSINSSNLESVNMEVEENEILVALRVDLEEERLTLKKNLESVLTNSEATMDEKNEAYDKLTYLNTILGSEERLEDKIKNKFNIECFIEINNNEINVVAISSVHDVKLANNIMRSIQEEYNEKVYVTVNFK
ncbi:MAG: SpoIIIAH-like family protein [Bacilli bacterium]|nr:SpoIIIAH-like family protein [Bacilli bacterium]